MSGPLNRTNNGSQLNNKLFLTKDKYGYEAWHRAAERVNLEALETLWIWAKQAEVNRDKLKNNLFLVQNEEGQAAFHKSADDNNTEILEKQFVWAKQKQTESR